MMRSLFLKTLYDKRWFMLGWSLATFGMAWLIILFFPSLQNGLNIEDLIKSMPKEMQGLVGSIASYSTVDGYITTQLFDIRLPLFVLIMALVLAQNVSVNEEDQGLTRTLAATALSRSRILFEKWLAGLAIMGSAALAAVFGSYAGILSIGEPPNHDLLWQLGLMTWLLGIAAISIPMMVGFATGSKAVATLIGLLVTIGSFILTTFGRSVDWLETAEYASLMHYFNPGEIADNGLPAEHILVLGGVTLIALALGWLNFRRRDIG